MFNANRWYAETFATSNPNRVRHIFRRTHSLYPGNHHPDEMQQTSPAWHCREDWLAMRQFHGRAAYGSQHADMLKRAIKRRLGYRAFDREIKH